MKNYADFENSPIFSRKIEWRKWEVQQRIEHNGAQKRAKFKKRYGLHGPFLDRDLYSPPNAKVPPQARRNYPPNQPQKFWYVPEVYDKSPGRWERKWIKNQFPIEIFVCKFQNFQILMIFSPNTQKFAARFLNLY